MRPKPHKHRVAVLTYPNLCTFEFGIAMEIFAMPRPELDVPWYECRVCSFQRGPLQAVGGISVTAPFGSRTLEWADTIIIPGWTETNHSISPRIVKAIRKAMQRGARLVSICSGVFVLAAAGVLDGRRATTHWRYVDRLSKHYPEIDLEPDALYVDDGNILTSAGSASGLDLCLHIVDRDYGSSVANVVARRLVLPAHRDGGQTQYTPAPVSSTDRTLGPLLDKLRAKLGSSHTVASMATQAGHSERTFVRRFRDATGQSPHAWLISERVRHARSLLETTSLNSEQIAEQCGFSTAETLRHHFRRAVGVPPMKYRASFRVR